MGKSRFHLNFLVPDFVGNTHKMGKCLKTQQCGEDLIWFFFLNSPFCRKPSILNPTLWGINGFILYIKIQITNCSSFQFDNTWSLVLISNSNKIPQIVASQHKIIPTKWGSVLWPCNKGNNRITEISNVPISQETNKFKSYNMGNRWFWFISYNMWKQSWFTRRLF